MKSYRVTQSQIHESGTERNPVNGLQEWSTRGIAGRGVLIDYASWAERNGSIHDNFRQHPITIDDLKAIAAEQNTVFRRGDILFLRTCYVKAYSELSAEQRVTVSTLKAWVGLGQGKETTEFLWQNQFAAVASDSPGFECRRKPPPIDLRGLYMV
jgi:hypothetical protein